MDHKSVHKELKKLNRKELLQLLLEQCELSERAISEKEETEQKMRVIEESYERLKHKLNVKDERLNAKDAQIAALKKQIEDIQKNRAIDIENAGSIAEAALKLNGIFDVAQKCADQYLQNVRALASKEQQAYDDKKWDMAMRDRSATYAKAYSGGTDSNIVKLPDPPDGTHDFNGG